MNASHSAFLRKCLTGLILIATASIPVQASAQSVLGYTNRNLRGTYVFRTQGWNRGNSGSQALGDSLGPFHAVGMFKADGSGNLSGTETVNVILNTNGTPTTPAGCNDSSTDPSATVCINNLSGAYSINDDGTGVWTITKTPVPGSDCRCGGATTQFTIILEGGPHEASDRVLYATQSSAMTASGQADRRTVKGTRR